MAVNPEQLLQAAVFLPLAGAVLIGLAGSRPDLRETVTLVTAVALFVVIYLLYRSFEQGGQATVTLVETLPGLTISFHTEPLGLLFALVAGFLWIVTSIYSIGYMRGNREHHQTRFYVYFAVALASTMGIALSANMFSLFIFYEILTLSTYPLVTHKGNDEAKAAGRVYLGVLLGTSIGLQLFAMIWTWIITGTLDFTEGGVFDSRVSETVLLILFTLYIFGIGKAAVMPFHRWLPAAMVAPTPVSALLHAVAVVKAGVFTVMKVSVYLFGIDTLAAAAANQWILLFACATIIIASVIALGKDNLKARLAYSTISQLSYVVMATVVLAPLTVAGAAIHIAAHAFGKITLFFAAGSIYTTSGKTKVSQLNGIGHKMPWTMTAFTIGSLSMIGVPPAAGFLSKWYMLQGAWAVENWFVITIIVISTLLNAGYFLPIVYAAFFRQADDEDTSSHGEAPFPIVLALVLTAAGTVLLFLLPGRLLELVEAIRL